MMGEIVFEEVKNRRRLKANASKCKVMIMNGEESVECEVHVDGIHLGHVSEF